MSEADIIYQISEVLNRMWDLQQWWASVSFGVLVAAYLVGKHLNGFLISILLLLYSVYSLYMWELLGTNADVYVAFVDDLQGISESGVTLSSGASTYLSPPTMSYFLVPIVLIGTYMSVISYTIYVFCHTKNNDID